MNYKVIRSNRKSLGLQVCKDGVIVRAPLFVSDKEIDLFVQNHREWISEKLIKIEEKMNKTIGIVPLTQEEIHKLADEALKVIPERVKYYASKIGVNYGKITIRNQRSKWGSCSAKGNLNFNVILMLTPPEIIDSIVVHELCHLKEMNHSNRFYAEVLKVYPNYWTCDKWLKENGEALMTKLHG